MNTETEIPVRECLRCHHRWIPRQRRPPQQCPACHSPYWQTPRQYTKRGRPTKVIEIAVTGDYQPKRHRTWGRWRLNRKPPYITLDFPTAGGVYDIRLDRCNTPRSRELWLEQMNRKRYVTSADLGDLTRAFIDLMRQGDIPIGANR
jgi:hypothetical protein